MSVSDSLKSNPNLLFLLDGIGALLSAFLLGVVLVNFQSYFGIPASTLYILAVIPVIFSIYDILCFKKLKAGHTLYLYIIAISNLLYCTLSLGFAFYHKNTITYLGWAYIILEIMIIISLSMLELKIAVIAQRKV